jgi:hypothetical protein
VGDADEFCHLFLGQAAQLDPAKTDGGDLNARFT